MKRRSGGVAPPRSAAQPYIRKGGNSSSNPKRIAPDGTRGGKGSNYRSPATIRRLEMYRSKPNLSKEESKVPARIQPDRRWFSNTRVMSQEKLDEFRSAMRKAASDPYDVVLKRSKLPISLFSDGLTKKEAKMHLLNLQSFEESFGPKAQRKRPRLEAAGLDSIRQRAEAAAANYGDGDQDRAAIKEAETVRHAVSAEVFKKGGSKRIWQELYKVIDSSDILVQVLDARNPNGTRCKDLEKYLKKDRPQKHMILLVNKVDLIPTWATARWVKILSTEYPTVAFHASITNPFGKQPFISLLRQYASLMKEKSHVSVGFIGYPNVGKSSVINTLQKKKVSNTSPTPGETRVWQFVSLTSRVHLIDCPGIVPSDADASSECAKIMRGVIRAEKLDSPEDYIDEILSHLKIEDVKKKYKIENSASWSDGEEFLTILAKKMGRLLKRGEPDLSTTARHVIYDFQRGRIPYFVPPPYAHTVDDAKREAAAIAEAAYEEKKKNEVVPTYDAQDYEFAVLAEEKEKDAAQRRAKRVKK